MRYTEHGLQIPLKELRRLLEYAENRVKYDNMEPCVYISPGDRPRILQYAKNGHLSADKVTKFSDKVFVLFQTFTE